MKSAAMKSAAMKKTAMKSAMKVGMKVAMKTGMKKKAMKVSKIASGKLRKAVVFRGSKEKTSGGLTKSQLMKNKQGRVVSKAASLVHKKLYVGSKLEFWNKALELGITGFVKINGPSAQGKALYAKAKALYTKA